MEGLYIAYIQRKFLPWKKRQGFLFTMETFMLQSNYLQVSISDFEHVDGTRFMSAMMYNAAKLWSLTEGKKVNFDENTVSKWIDKMTSKDVSELTNTFFKTKIAGETLDSLIIQGEEEKKKIMKKKKSPSKK